MNARKILALGVLLASVALTGCDEDEPTNADASTEIDSGVRSDGGDAAGFPDADVPQPDGGIDAGTDGGTPPGDGGVTFSDFVHDLIINRTSSSASPVDLPNPDLPDNEDPASYDDLF